MPLVRFSAQSLNKDLKVSTTKESGRIVTHKKHASFQMEIKKQGAQN